MTCYTLDGISPTLPEDGDFWVAPTAQVIGTVTVHSGVSIWFGAVLRGDNEPILLGAGTNIQENAVIHTDPGFAVTIGENCTIGHGAIVHGCTIEDTCLIGMGATILNGAVIGRKSLVAAGALVTEGKVIPEGSLVVGMPAKVLRPLDEKAVLGLKQSALHYQANMRRFKAGLQEI